MGHEFDKILKIGDAAYREISDIEYWSPSTAVQQLHEIQNKAKSQFYICFFFMGLYVEPRSSYIERRFGLAVSCQHAMFAYI